MNPTKINQLFDTLRAACSRQFGFNPRRITADVRYLGTEGHGKDLMHVFRTAGCHSQLALKGTYVTLREKSGDKPHWDATERSYFKNSDAEIDAEIAAKQAKLEYTRNSPLYRDHREQLLSHYKDWPGYRDDGIHPREAAKQLVVALFSANDAQLTAFAEHMGTSDAEQLAHLLVEPCHFEIEASKAAPAMADRE